MLKKRNKSKKIKVKEFRKAMLNRSAQKDLYILKNNYSRKTITRKNKKKEKRKNPTELQKANVEVAVNRGSKKVG